MSETVRKPAAFRLDPPEPEAPRPRRLPRAGAAPEITFEAGEPAADRALVSVPPRPRPRGWRWGALFVSSLGALVSLGLGLSVTRLIEDLFARSAVFGWIALGLAGLAGLAAAAIIAREMWGLARLDRIEVVQVQAARALNQDDGDAAKAVIAALKDIYGGRADAAWGLAAVREQDGLILDPRDRVRLAERALLAPLDEAAHRLIARGARRVALVTTVTPAAALDILFVAAFNLRLLRQLAGLYGGRPSGLATLKLARLVVGHLAVTGGLALTDSLMQHVVGKGLIGRLSARFGEGTVNGILTARIGLAAREVCRPIPQEPKAKETLASLLREAFSFDAGEAANAPRRTRA